MKVYKPGELTRKIRKIPDLLKRELDVLIAMAECADGNGSNCFPGEKLLMSMAGYKKRDTVTYALSGLRKKALILRDGKHGYSDKYQLNIPGMLNYVAIDELTSDGRGGYLTPNRTSAIERKDAETLLLPPKQKMFPAKNWAGVNIANQLPPSPKATETSEPTPIPEFKPARNWKTNERGLHTDGWVMPSTASIYAAYEGQEQRVISEQDRIEWGLESARRLRKLGLAPDKLREYGKKNKLPQDCIEEIIMLPISREGLNE